MTIKGYFSITTFVFFRNIRSHSAPISMFCGKNPDCEYQSVSCESWTIRWQLRKQWFPLIWNSSMIFGCPTFSSTILKLSRYVMKKMLTFSSESAKNYYLINGHIMWAIGMILSFINETTSPPPYNGLIQKKSKLIPQKVTLFAIFGRGWVVEFSRKLG